MLTPSLSVSKVFENGMIPVKLKKSRAFSLKIKLLRDNMCRFPEKTAKMFESSHRVSGTHIGGRVSASSTVDGRRSFAASRRFSFVSRGWIAIAGRRPASTTSAGLRPANASRFFAAAKRPRRAARAFGLYSIYRVCLLCFITYVYKCSPMPN